MAIYFDCAATTPLDPRVRDEMLVYLNEDFGNAGSRTHEFGRRARAAVERARDRVAEVMRCSRGDVVFTSGATESNNLALLGLARHGEASGRRHVLSTQIEHHAVLEPLNELQRRGFDVELVPPDASGVVDADALLRAVRPDTLLVSVMHVNNETGARQPIEEIAAGLADRDVVLHVDGAQSFGKELQPLRDPRLDLVSISGHKIYGPKGVGALIVRRRGGARAPIEPLLLGGGQERGLRPGTLAVPLIAGLGKAAELALAEWDQRARRCRELRERLLAGLAPLKPELNGDPARCVPHILNLAIPGMDGEALIEAWSELVAISQGAACTSHAYTCSHVLGAMGLPAWRHDGAVRLSWSHMTELPDTARMVEAVLKARRAAGALAP
jgi:cysteine desulfurase